MVQVCDCWQCMFSLGPGLHKMWAGMQKPWGWRWLVGSCPCLRTIEVIKLLGAVMSNALLLLAHSYLIKNTSHRKYPVIPPRPPPGGSFERSRGKDHQSQNQKGNMHYCHPCLAICFAVLQVLVDSDNDTATARETAPALQAKHSSIISD